MPPRESRPRTGKLSGWQAGFRLLDRSPDDDPPRVHGYTTIKKLGQGGDDSVFEASTDQGLVAIKRVSLTKFNQTKSERNVQLHEELKGVTLDYVVQIYEVLDDPVKDFNSVLTKFCSLQHRPGDLAHPIKSTEF